MGYSIREIALKVLGGRVSHATVVNDIKEIKQRYNESILESRQALVRERLDLLRDIRQEAFEAWERSKENAEKRTTKMTPGLEALLKKRKRGARGRRDQKGQEVTTDQLKDMFISELTEVVEGRLPASEYMNIILKTVEQERALLGLDEALKVDMSVGSLNWSDLFPPPRAAEPVRVVDAPRLPPGHNGKGAG